MLIKPVSDDLLFADECIGSGNVTDLKNEIIVHDLEPFPFTVHNGTHDLVGCATQTIESIVKSFPIINDEEFSIVNNSNSFIKRTYFYLIYMSSAYKSFEDKFKHADLIFKGATVTGFTDAKFNSEYYVRTMSSRPVNEFALTFYSDNKILTTIGTDSYLSNIRLDICNPLNIVNKRLTSWNDELLCRDIPNRYIGSDFNLTSLKYTENRINDVENEKLRRKMSKMLPDLNGNNQETDNFYNIIELRMAIRNFIVDMSKIYYLSLFEEYILVYRSNCKPGFKRVISPVNKIVDGFTIPQMEYIRNEFIKLCKSLEDRFNEEIDVKYFVTFNESICQVKLLKSNLMETKRMINLESLETFINESMYDPKYGINKFKHDMDLDNITVYSHRQDEYNITHNGNLL